MFVSRSTSWGALGVYRGAGEPPFTAEEIAEVGGICDTVAAAIQRSSFRLPSGEPALRPSSEVEGPAVLIVDAHDRPTQLTPAARAAIEELGGWDHGSLPANVLAVVATTRSTGEHFTTRTLSTTERWMSLRAAPLDGGGAGRPCDVVVSIEPTSRATLSRLALAAHGLTSREEEVALLVLQGVNTQGISAALHLSPHTVQDHLKAIFAKVGVSSRRELTARLVLA